MTMGMRSLLRQTAVPLVFAGFATGAWAQGNDNIIVGLAGDPTMINSGITTEINSSVVGAQVYSTILRLDADGEPIPSLAKSWEISPDGKTYTFHFFEGIQWHDGTPFTSEDVAWSLENLNRKFNGPAGGLLGSVEVIETPDPLTAVFRLSAPYPPLLRGLAYFNSSMILPKHIFDVAVSPQENPANLAPVGTGPFMFKEYRPGSHFAFERNPNYHLEGPMIDRLVYQIIPNAAARALALEKGDIDFIPYHVMPLGEVDRLSAARDVTVTFQKRSIAGQYQAFLNTRQGPLADKRVRQALFYAMDRQELLDKAGFGHGMVSKGGAFSSELPIFYTENVRQYPQDVEKANQLLDEAGFARGADGKRFALRVSYSLSEGPMANVSRLLRAQFAAVGVDIIDEGMETAAWREKVFVQWDFDITMGSYASGPDPAIGAAGFFTCERIVPRSGFNTSGYCNPELDEILAAGSVEFDEQKRIGLYHQAAAILAEDVPHWWFWDRYYPIGYRTGLTGVTDDITGYGTMDLVRWTD